MRSPAAGAGAKYLGIAFGAVLLGIYIAYYFDYRAAVTHILSANWSFLGLSIASFLVATYVRCLKWIYIVRISSSMTWTTGLHVMMATNMLNFLLPVRFGEVVRLYLVKRVAEVPYSTSVAATLIDRISGLLTLALAFSLYPIAGFANVDPIHFWWAFGLIATTSVVFLLLGHHIGTRLPFVTRRVLAIAGLKSARIERIVTSRPLRFAQSTLLACHLPRYGWRMTGVVFGLSVLFVIGDAAAMYFLMNAFSLPLTLLQGLVAASVFNFAFILPSAPAQIGTAEMLPVLVFAYGFGLAQDVVASSALLWHFFSAALIVALGGLSTYHLGARLVLGTRDK